MASRLHRYINEVYLVKNTKETVSYIIRNVIKLSLNCRIIELQSYILIKFEFYIVIDFIFIRKSYAFIRGLYLLLRFTIMFIMNECMKFPQGLYSFIIFIIFIYLLFIYLLESYIY